ncbi:hypothetical protein [Pedobacter mendelii]|nr:hypothetical protein [Pedobacter mendelii]
MRKQQNSFIGASNALSRTEMKNILAGYAQPEPKDCKDVVCKAEDWCCDAKGTCMSRTQTTC